MKFVWLVLGDAIIHKKEILYNKIPADWPRYAASRLILSFKHPGGYANHVETKGNNHS